MTSFDVNACRAYFQLKNGLMAGEPTNPSQPGIRSFVLNFGDDEEMQGIESLTPNPIPMGEGSGYYTLDGVKLDKLPVRKGLYIKNGKKVVIK